MSKMTQAQSIGLASALYGLGIEAIAMYSDYAPKNPDGTYVGSVEKIYYVQATVRDARRGNMVVRDIRSECDAGKLAKEMQREIKARANDTRARIRAERATDES